MYYGELVIDMAQISLGLRSIEHLWLLLAVITIYSREIVATTRSRGHFEPHLQCACAEAIRILLPISDLITPFDPAWLKTYIATKFWLKTQFYGILSHIFTAHAQKRPEYYFRYQIWPRHSIRHARKPICLWNCGWKCCFKGTLRHVCTAHAQKGQNTTSGFRSDHAIRSGMVENLYSHEIVAKNALLGALWAIFLLRMRRNGHNTTSGIKSDHAIRSGMPENLYIKEILAKNAILWVFFSNVKFSPYSLHWRFSAHARKTGSCCPILMPNELVLTILVPKHRAKFGDDRLRIAGIFLECQIFALFFALEIFCACA